MVPVENEDVVEVELPALELVGVAELKPMLMLVDVLEELNVEVKVCSSWLRSSLRWSSRRLCYLSRR